MSGGRTVRIGTRASALALWQAREVAARIAAQPDAPAVELIHIRTSGDQQADVPLWQVGGRAFFTREIDRALLAAEVDVAVHSLKDLPTQLDEGLVLAALLPRADPRDALVSRSGARPPEAARARASAPVACAAGHSSRASVRMRCRSSYVAMCRRASSGCSAESMTPSSSLLPVSPGSTWRSM